MFEKLNVTIVAIINIIINFAMIKHYLVCKAKS